MQRVVEIPAWWPTPVAGPKGRKTKADTRLGTNLARAPGGKFPEDYEAGNGAGILSSYEAGHRLAAGTWQLTKIASD